MASNQYIKREQFEQILRDLNYETCDENARKDLLDRATGDLEADLAEKFIVPLVPRLPLTLYTECPEFARNKVLNAIRAKIKELIGFDKNRVLMGAIESTEKFINVHGDEYKSQKKDLLKQVIDYKFRLLSQAEDSQTPVQHLGLARGENDYDYDSFGIRRGWRR